MHPLLHSLLTAANPRFTESAEAGSGEILLAHQAAAGKWWLFCAAVFPFNLFAAAHARQKAQTLRQRCP
ncbi:hypothetical protein [Kingella sp. (in: b-proteobacteria)]|uniref:hypothetical protein n=1 Tax=Kingella sp. (in: b-proteobacteria) TaxID=2020713 RepID=UPI0026DA7950|nr:hypothetical protein [Kingella sp. (in: b-proteobacteria)]MDO4657232.1 hypothetical protein [Kingella sp. (in: b-proteobacteria)]